MPSLSPINSFTLSSPAALFKQLAWNLSYFYFPSIYLPSSAPNIGIPLFFPLHFHATGIFFGPLLLENPFFFCVIVATNDFYSHHNFCCLAF